MIWFYIAGFISGMVATLMIGKHFAEKEKENGLHRQNENS